MLVNRLLLIIFSTVIMSLTLAQEPSNDKQIKQEKQNPKQQNYPTKIDTSSLEKTIRESIKEASDKPDTHAEEKLQIDRQIETYTGQLSEYTAKLSIWTLILAIATIVVAIFNIFLWCETRKGGRAAEKAANAAKDSIDAHHASERAWIIKSGDPLDNDIVDKDKITGEIYPGGIGFSIRWQNTGRTPALNCVLYSRSMTAVSEINAAVLTDNDNLTWSQKIPLVIPGDTITAPGCYFEQIHVDRLINEKSEIFIYGRIEYNDVFTNQLRKTEICLMVTFGGYRSGSVKIFNFTPIGDLNKST